MKHAGAKTIAWSNFMRDIMSSGWKWLAYKVLFGLHLSHERTSTVPHHAHVCPQLSGTKRLGNRFYVRGDGTRCFYFQVGR